MDGIRCNSATAYGEELTSLIAFEDKPLSFGSVSLYRDTDG